MAAARRHKRSYSDERRRGSSSGGVALRSDRHARDVQLHVDGRRGRSRLVSVTADDFLEFARRIAGAVGSEIDIRNVVSRTYYSAFLRQLGVALNAMRQQRNAADYALN